MSKVHSDQRFLGVAGPVGDGPEARALKEARYMMVIRRRLFVVPGADMRAAPGLARIRIVPFTQDPFAASDAPIVF